MDFKSDIEFMEKLVAGTPELEALYREHLGFYNEILTHVLMGEISELVISTAADGRFPDWLATLLEQMEAGLISGQAHITELVAASFVENLCGEDRAIAALMPKLGFALRRALQRMCGP